MFEGIRDTIRAFIDSISTISIDELPERLTLIREAIVDPRANPLPFFMGLSMLIIVALIVVVSLVLAWMLLTRDRTNRLNYAILDREGEVIERIPVEDAPRMPLSSRQRWARRSLRFILTVAGVTALIASFGAATQSRAFCGACHQSTAHTLSVTEGSHSTIACTSCHETGLPLQSYTTNAFVRLNHVVWGLIDADTPLSGYGTVTTTSCLRCHEEAIETTSPPSKLTGVRMSHAGPLEAGMGCTVCHAFNETQEIGAPDRGMQVCLKCHNNERVVADCGKCHTKNPLSVSRNAQWSFASPLLGNTDPRQSCYRCHDPGPCDRCHGIRMPHPDAFSRMDLTEGGHGSYSRAHGVTVCFNCHNGQSTMGATDCYACHPKGMF